MRSTISFFKRAGSRGRKPLLYIRFWDPERKGYTVPKSVASMIKALDLDPTVYSPYTKASARLVAEEWLKRGYLAIQKSQQHRLVTYLEEFWDWEKSDYIRGKLARNAKSIGLAYVKNNQSYIRRYIIPKIGDIGLEDATPGLFESILSELHEQTCLTGRTLNSILQAIRIPFAEAVRLGYLKANPASKVRLFSENTLEKGILTSDEVKALFNYQGKPPAVLGDL